MPFYKSLLFMGLLSSLFGCGNQKESKKNSNSAPIVNSAFYADLIDLIATPTIRDELKKSTEEAFKNPKAFYNDSNKYTLADRGLIYPEAKALTPKFVLIDQMCEKNQMAEIDWKSPEEDIRFNINVVLQGKNYTPRISEENIYDENTETIELINRVNDRELKPAGYSLEILDINSDSYVFTIIPIGMQQEVQGMFDQLESQ